MPTRPCFVCTGCGEDLGPAPDHALLAVHRRCPGKITCEDE